MVTNFARLGDELILQVYISGYLGVSYVVWPGNMHEANVHQFKELLGSQVLHMDDLDPLKDIPLSIPSISMFPLAFTEQPYYLLNPFDAVYLGHQTLTLAHDEGIVSFPISIDESDVEVLTLNMRMEETHKEEF